MLANSICGFVQQLMHWSRFAEKCALALSLPTAAIQRTEAAELPTSDHPQTANIPLTEGSNQHKGRFDQSP
jgi:hypothetical protein